jgi:hypothetical protein
MTLSQSKLYEYFLIYMAIVLRAPEFIVQDESSKRSLYYGLYSITWNTSRLS